MKKVLFLSLVGGALAGGGFYLMAAEPEPETPKPRTFTVTEAQLDEIVQRKVAQLAIAEERSLDAVILDGKNWHTAIFNPPGERSIQYTIYTGPGRVVSQVWAPPEKPVEQPVEKPAAEPKK